MKTLRMISVVLANSILGLALLGGSAAGYSIPAPFPLGELDRARGDHSATLMTGGSILIVGGKRERRTGGAVSVRRAELVNPRNGHTTYVGTMPWGVADHTAIRLPGYRVLIVGGDARGSACTHRPALLWKGATKTFKPVKSLPNSEQAAATKLKDGRVLISGGGVVCREGKLYRNGTTKAVVWDPATGKAKRTGSLAAPRERHRSIRLPDGRVLITGGRTCRYPGGTRSCTPSETVEVWDPATGNWATTGSAPILAGDRLTRLPGGRIALTGGPLPGKVHGLWVWDPGSGDFEPGTKTPKPIHAGHEAYVTNGGNLAIVGGDRGDGTHKAAAARFWEPGSDQWARQSYPGPDVIGGQTLTPRKNKLTIVIGGHAAAGSRLRSISRITTWADVHEFD